MTVYENLKRKEEILRGASLRAESPDMKVMWLEKSKELKKKINEMTVEDGEKEGKVVSVTIDNLKISINPKDLKIEVLTE